MSRNSSGVYTQPNGTAAVSGATIDPTANNTLISDIANELTNSLDRGGRGAMTAALNLGGYKGYNAADPTVSTDLATKNYVDTAVSGSSPSLSAYMQKTNNLSDLTNATTARTNLGLGGSATLSVGTTAGTVCAGNDSRLDTSTLAPKASPALTGTPTAPTAAGGTNTTQVATTAFVAAAVSGVANGVYASVGSFVMGYPSGSPSKAPNSTFDAATFNILVTDAAGTSGGGISTGTWRVLGNYTGSGSTIPTLLYRVS